MAGEEGKPILRGAIDLMTFPAAALALFAALNAALVPSPAEAQTIKPPPVVLFGRNAPRNTSTLSFKPVRLVYRQSEGEGFRKPTGVFVDGDTGEILVADSASNLVSVLNRDGVPLHSFGYNGEVIQPSKAVLDKRGRILVLGGVPRKVKVFSYRGESLGDFGLPGFDGAARAVPTALTVDGVGNLYIADSTSGRILVYDGEGRLSMTFGKRGEGPGGFTSVTAITVDPSGTIYVTDAQHTPAIQLFDSQGNYLRGWGEHSGGPQNVSLPSGIAVGPSGNVFVADTIRQTIAVFTSDGHYLSRFGGLGTSPGSLAYPTDLAVDAAGRLYVTEASNTRLQVFEPMSGGAVPPAPDRGRQGLPRNDREEIRQGLGDVLKDMQR